MSDQLLSTISFSVFSKWYVEFYLKNQPVKSNYQLVKLRKIIKPIKRKIKKVDYDGKLPLVSKIVFSTGEIVFRDERKTGMDLLIVEKGDLLVSNINFHQGAVAYNNIGDFACSTHYQTYTINSNLILPQYLITVLRSDTFINIVSGIKANGIKNESGYNFIGDFDIPLPPISEQQALLDKYNEDMKKADEAENQSKTLNDRIDSIISKYMNCSENKKESISSALLKVKAFSKMINWGAKFNANAISPKELFFSKRYRNVALSSVAEVNPTTNYPEQIINEKISFLPMECISDVYGEISEMRNGTVANTKGYTRFKENDILWAKITPCMQNGKCAIARNLENGYGYGSTEYHVIRANTEKVLPEYLYCFLRTQLIREVAQTYFSGSAGQQRVGADFLENLNIPLLPIRSDDKSQITQENMVKHVFEVKERIKALRKEAESLRQRAKKEFEAAVFG